ncbi:App1 family protein [Pelagovum pacificum]|uniref:DUF2183 domain-containing protein n=1 Tax=Pelagovum pacificum TaxID=2588711 RepID=A0A5C5GJ87_9RHOB|nr:phosphatase domain-containing protein [Pelagovum pacificum]QQA42915.1 DUF2183 domain-containing protein [Pelagovum pacificum]TNY33941.1 DUF2183 domain-containing protein [Pelagovum pacificum]
MKMVGYLARFVHRIEGLFDRRQRRRQTGAQPVIEPYIGYATPEEIVLRGRVLTALRRSEPRPDQHWFTNFRQMLRLFLTDEVSGVSIRARGCRVASDEEGYFTLSVPRDGVSGWVEVKVEHLDEVPAPGGLPYAWEDGEMPVAEAVMPAFAPGTDAEIGVISDVDDTMLQTGAWSRIRLVWTSLMGNIHTRHIFPDAVELISRLSAGGRNPVFYVSSSPWNLHDFLERVFARHNLVRGPMFLRDFGLNDKRPLASSHSDHKSHAIDTILAANPGLPFVLIGDTGQFDSEIYAAAARRHKGRIQRVILRAPRRKRDAATEVNVRTLRQKGIPVHVGPDFSEAIEVLGGGR